MIYERYLSFWNEMKWNELNWIEEKKEYWEKKEKERGNEKNKMLIGESEMKRHGILTGGCKMKQNIYLEKEDGQRKGSRKNGEK